MAQLTPTAAQGQGVPAHWPQDQYNIPMQYACDGDSNQMWTSSGQMPSNACWSVPMDPPQMIAPQMAPPYPYAPQLQQTMLSQDTAQMSPLAGQQMPQAFLQQPQMPLAPPEMAMQTPQVAPSPTSGSGSPADIDRCMAIVMPGAGYSHVTADLVAAQLKAMAETQGCYED